MTPEGEVLCQKIDDYDDSDEQFGEIVASFISEHPKGEEVAREWLAAETGVSLGSTSRWAKGRSVPAIVVRQNVLGRVQDRVRAVFT